LEKIKGKHGSFEFLLFIGTYLLEGKIDKSRRRLSERMLSKGNNLTNGLLRGMRHIYRQVIRLTINDMKIKAISLNSCMNNKSNKELTRGLPLRETSKDTSPQSLMPTWH